MTATSAGAECQKLGKLCDECRDGNVKNSGLSAASAGTVMSRTRNYSATSAGNRIAVTEGLAAMGQCHGRWQSQWEVCSDASLKKVWLLQEQ
jgi:hypothetical protein